LASAGVRIRQWPARLASRGLRRADRDAGGHAALDQLTRWLWDAVMAPLLATLPAKRTVLVPAGLLGLLPLHAAWTNDPHTPTGRRYALDEALRTYAPNARALTAARRLADRIPVEHVLVVEEPWPVDASPLPYVLDEARAALAAFPLARHLRREQRWLRDHPGTERRSANADEVDAVCQHYVAGGREDEEACSATKKAKFIPGSLKVRDLLIELGVA
jgi:CHAT domain